MKLCPKCQQPMSTESFPSADGDFLGWFCGNRECEDYDPHLAGDAADDE